MPDVFVQLPSGTILRTKRPDLWKEGKRISRPKAEAQLAAEARAYLLGVLKPGDTVYTVLRHCSRSGMYRRISLMVAPAGGSPLTIDGYALNLGLGDRPRGSAQGIGVGGCGMDMGFHLVYALAYALWPQGAPCAGESCPSNDHSNGDRDYTRHSAKRPHLHRDGGYALRHKWL